MIQVRPQDSAAQKENFNLYVSENSLAQFLFAVQTECPFFDQGVRLKAERFCSICLLLHKSKIEFEHTLLWNPFGCDTIIRGSWVKCSAKSSKGSSTASVHGYSLNSESPSCLIQLENKYPRPVRFDTFDLPCWQSISLKVTHIVLTVLVHTQWLSSRAAQVFLKTLDTWSLSKKRKKRQVFWKTLVFEF